MAYGNFIEIKGAVSYFIFALPIIITIICMKTQKKSYEKRIYYSLVDTKFLTVRIVKESENYRYLDFISWD